MKICISVKQSIKKIKQQLNENEILIKDKKLNEIDGIFSNKKS